MAPSRRPASHPSRDRFQAVDLLRGVAIVLMIAFHLAFDLNYLGVVALNIYDDPFWIHSRTVIVTLFLLAVGISLHLATARGVDWRRFGRRLALIAGGAGLVTLSSLLMFPQSWIFFGVLHFIALASVAGLAFARFYWFNLAGGVAILALAANVTHPFFDQEVWQWMGMMTRKPVTEDYVPMVPWFGMVLLGLFIGKTVYGKGSVVALAGRRGDNRVVRLLALGGRHSLLIYLVHQPLLLGLSYLAVLPF